MQVALASQSGFRLQSKDAAKLLLSFSSVVASKVDKFKKVSRTRTRLILYAKLYLAILTRPSINVMV